MPRVLQDPFVFRDRRGNFHALFHKFTDEHPDAGGLAWSRDGFDWTLPNDASYTTVVQHSDGSSRTYGRRERPYLLFAEDGVTPLFLFTSLTDWDTLNATGTDHAFSFAQKIAM